MRKYMRAGIIAVAATAALGVPAAGAFASTQPVTEQTGIQAEAPTKQVKRTYVKTVNLRGGMTAKVYKLAKGHQADIYLGKVKLGALTAVHKADLTINDGVVVKLTPNGTITSWWKKAGVNKPGNKPNKDRKDHGHKGHKKPGKPSVKPNICPPGPTPDICPPGPAPEICPPGPVDLTDPANIAYQQ